MTPIQALVEIEPKQSYAIPDTGGIATVYDCSALLTEASTLSAEQYGVVFYRWHA